MIFKLTTKNSLTLCRAVREKNPKYTHVADMAERCFGRDLPLSKLTRNRLNELKKHISANVSRNSARTYLAVVKSVLNDFPEVVPCNDFGFLNIKGQDTISAFLGLDELARLEDMAGSVAGRERLYLLLFLVQAWTGCRVSDASRLDIANISGERLSYVSKKTGTRAVIPVKKGLNEWLAEVKRGLNGYGFCERTYNRAIKDVCRAAGIDSEVKTFRAGQERTCPKWEAVSTHTARRSFATNLYLSGVDIYSIGRMMGHSSVDMTRRYICCGIREDERIREFFE